MASKAFFVVWNFSFSAFSWCSRSLTFCSFSAFTVCAVWSSCVLVSKAVCAVWNFSCSASSWRSRSCCFPSFARNCCSRTFTVSSIISFAIFASLSSCILTFKVPCAVWSCFVNSEISKFNCFVFCSDSIFAASRASFSDARLEIC